MIKAESLKELQGILKEKGVELTQGQVEEVLNGIEELCVKVVQNNDSVSLGGFLKVERVERKERRGTTNLPGKESKDWVKPACFEPVAKFTKGFIEKHTVEK